MSIQPANTSSHHQSTQPEDDFVELFSQVFGLEKTLLLAPEFPFLDVDGTPRYMNAIKLAK